MPCGVRQCIPLWSVELHALGVPSVWAVWVLLLRWTDYYGFSGGWDWPPIWLAFRPCLVWRLLVTCGWAGYWRGWLHSQGIPRSGFSSLTGEAGAQGILRLVPTQLWMRLNPVASASPLMGGGRFLIWLCVGSWVSWSWCQPTGIGFLGWCLPTGGRGCVPESLASLLVVEAMSLLG